MPRARRSPVPGQAGDPRGGPRVGTPGRQYANRSDLTAQPVRVATGQPYGEAGAQAAAQRAVPLPQTPGPPTVAAAPPVSGPPGGPYPGEVTSLQAPTQRPNEPLTHGLPMGPGAGPEVLPQTAPPDNVGSLVARLASQPGATPELQFLASYLKSGKR